MPASFLWALDTPCQRFEFTNNEENATAVIKQFLKDGASCVRLYQSGYHLATFGPRVGVDGPDASSKVIFSKVRTCLATIRKSVYQGH